jgi:hypothetical protein
MAKRLRPVSLKNQFLNLSSRVTLDRALRRDLNDRRAELKRVWGFLFGGYRNGRGAAVR